MFTIACPLCRARYPDGAARCQVCGHDLTASFLRVCPICAALNPSASAHCRRCGGTLAALSGAASPAVSAESSTALQPKPSGVDEGAVCATESAELAHPVFEGEEFIQALEPAEAHEIALDPLADLSAPLGLERSMAQPHRAALTPPPDPSEAERYDAALFEQIAGEPGGIMAHAMAEGARRVPREPRVVMPLGLRVTTYLLLLVAALAPFVLPPLSDGWVQPRAATVALGEAVAALPADSRVLLVWDYDASYSGELDPLAGTLIDSLQRASTAAMPANTPDAT